MILFGAFSRSINLHPYLSEVTVPYDPIKLVAQIKLRLKDFIRTLEMFGIILGTYLSIQGERNVTISGQVLLLLTKL